MKKPLFEPRWHAGSCLNWYILLSRIYSAGNTRYDPNTYYVPWLFNAPSLRRG